MLITKEKHEIAVYKPVPGKPGVSQWSSNHTPAQLGSAIRQILPDIPSASDPAVSLERVVYWVNDMCDVYRHKECPRFRQILVSLNRGSNEGWIIAVDLLLGREEKHARTSPLARVVTIKLETPEDASKTLLGLTEALCLNV